MPSKKAASAPKLAMKIPAAVGDKAVVHITTTTSPSTGALAATDPAVLTDILRSSLSSDAGATGAGAVLEAAAAAAQPGQEPDLPPPPAPPKADQPIPEPAQSPEPGPDAVRYAPIHDLADARALPDVTGGVYARATFDSPLAIRAFKDHDGRTMAVVWTGYTLAKAAITA